MAAMLKLLLLRAVPLVLRPVVILLEGYLVVDGDILVQTLPIAMMALTISSIPVHLDYYRADGNDPKLAALGARYVSALIWVTIISLVVLAGVLLLDMGGLLVVAICLFFLIEKLADEISRMLEFRKAFVKWFLVQALRSGWMLIPIAASLAGLRYELAFVASTALATVAFALLFVRVTGLAPRLDLDGLSAIRGNLVFLAGSFLPATYRQVPRILVARLFPDQAHIFLATAQLTQAVGLLFNVRFQIPYRKVIARKTRRFQKLVQPAMLRLLLIPAIIAPLSLAAGLLLPVDTLTGLPLAVALLPLLLGDAIAFAILAAHLGYLPWFERRRAVLVTYIVNGLLLLGLLALFQVPQVGEHLSILSITSSFILLGLAWLAVIQLRHFGLRKSA